MSRRPAVALVIGASIALVAVGVSLATILREPKTEYRTAALVTREVLGIESEVESSHDGVDYKTAFAFCDAGELAVGGGFRVGASASVTPQVTVTDSTHATHGSFGDGPRDGWETSAMAPVGVGHWELGAYAICAKLTEVATSP